MTTALKKTLRIILVFVFIGMVIGGCKKEEENNLYRLYLNPAVWGGKVILDGSVSAKGSHPVSESGFIIGKTNDISIDNNLSKVVSDSGSYDLGGRFFGTIYNLELSTDYYVKSYLKDTKGQFSYSDPSLISTACTDVDSISPRSGGSNTSITIYGRNFGTDINNLTIEFSSWGNSSYGKPTFVSNSIINVDFDGTSFNSGEKIGVWVNSGNCEEDSRGSKEKGSFTYIK